MEKEQIREKLSQDILTYAMAGSVAGRRIGREIKPDDLDDRFENFQMLLELHFLLRQDVVDFVKRLPKRLRNISTGTKNISRLRRGTVDGKINWGETISSRYTRNPSDDSIFICDYRSENYDTDENLVLRRLITIINEILDNAGNYIQSDYRWARDTWRGEEQLMNELRRLTERNVHIRRIRECEDYEPSERMLTTAENSRQPLYQEAASLLRTYNSIKTGDRKLIEQLLADTAITPDDDAKLFELYVLFRVIEALESVHDGNVQMGMLRKGRDSEFASFGDHPQLEVFYDQAAPGRAISFLTEQEIGGRSRSRIEKVHGVASDVTGEYLNHSILRTNRPDVLVVQVNGGDPQEFEYLIIEVKNSTNRDTIQTGVRETLEYLAFLRAEHEFVYGEGSGPMGYFGDGWSGLLVIQDLAEGKGVPLEAQSEAEIKILQAAELETELATLLGNSEIETS